MREIREEELNLVAGGDIDDNWCGTPYPGWWHHLPVLNPSNPIVIVTPIAHP